VILVSEPAFAGIGAYVFLDERLTARGWLGALLILAGMLVAELAPQREEAEG
jgi:drug/metabolite transporter (DMT)-like permease